MNKSIAYEINEYIYNIKNLGFYLDFYNSLFAFQIYNIPNIIDKINAIKIFIMKLLVFLIILIKINI